MRFIPVLLMCVYAFQCDAAPPRADTTKTHARGVGYTNEEDSFIVEELSRIAVDSQDVLGKSLWTHMASAHRQKRQQGTSRFPQERTAKSLRGHFKNMVKRNHSALSTILPESLLQKFRLDINKSLQGAKPFHSIEEEEFMVDELLNTTSNNPFSAGSLENLLEKHNLKRQAGTSGFEHERTVEGLRSHLYSMKKRNQLPEELMKKFRKIHKGASSSSAGHSNQQNDLELTNDEDDDEDDDKPF